jgi:hypothetical protein
MSAAPTPLARILLHPCASGVARISAKVETHMSAINGDKARFHRERKSKLARRERSQALRKKLLPAAPARRPDGRDL